MFDWKITGKKFLWALVEIVVAGWIVYATDKPVFFVLIPVLEATRNWLKHRKD